MTTENTPNETVQETVQDKVQEVIDKMPSRPQKNKAFRNTGNLRFEDAGDGWGFSDPSFSNGAAYGDLDNDGDLDLIVSNVNAPAFVYQNNSRQQHRPMALRRKLRQPTGAQLHLHHRPIADHTLSIHGGRSRGQRPTNPPGHPAQRRGHTTHADVLSTRPNRPLS